MSKLTFLLVMLVGLLSTNALAGDHHGHDHEPSVEPAPHGGMMRDSLPYKSEIVLNNDHVKIYVYNKDLTAVSHDKLAPMVTGELAFPKETTKRKVDFKLAADAYEATIPGISKVHRYDLHVTLMIEKKPIIADFGVDNIH